MSQTSGKGSAGPDLSPETVRRLEILFAPGDRERAAALLRDQCGNNLPFLDKANMHTLERFRFAALKYSDGNFAQLERAVKLAQRDWRDLLVAAGFANSLSAHERWEPKPAGEPSEIDPPRLVAGFHDRLAPVLTPLGFSREGDIWRRAGEIPQALQVVTGLTSRTEVRFFLKLTLDAKPKGVMLHLPRLPAGSGILTAEQGYIFRAGDDEAALYAAVQKDIAGYVHPWLSRFTSTAEVQRGFEDKTFWPHLPLPDKALLF